MHQRARTDLCGGRGETYVPTATFGNFRLVDRSSGIYAMQRSARTIRHDLEAVRNAVSEPWSNGQTEGQINKLKTLKRAMYGHAGVELLRARMMPL